MIQYVCMNYNNQQFGIVKDSHVSSIPPAPKVRDSQMELLRIVAMSMILIHHFVSHGADYEIMKEGLGFQNSFVFYGVNLFVMISGYYGIRVRWKSFLSLVITVIFFVLVDYVLKCLGDCWSHGFDISIFAGIGKVLARPFASYWFVSCYLILYVFAPVINIGLKHSTKSQLRAIVVIAACYCLYGGLTLDYAVSRGYEVSQFILLYLTGYWIKAESPFERVSVWWLVCIAVCCSLLNGTEVFQWIMGPLSGVNYSVSYINVLCYIGSIAIFLLFTRFSFSNRFVNSLAGASFGCYLLQDARAGSDYYYVLQREFYATHSFAESLLMYAASFVALWVASWVLTWFKNLWAPRLIDAVYRALPRRWKQEVW